MSVWAALRLRGTCMVSLPDTRGAGALPAYAELHCRSNFSFGCGASQPQELVARAHALGYAALALTDECSVAGVVRAHQEAQKLGLRLLPGAEFVVPHELPAPDGLPGEIRFSLLVLPRDLVAWGELCVFITAARRAAPKGQYRVRWPDPAWAALKGCEVILVLPQTLASVDACTLVRSVAAVFAPHLWLAVHLPLGPADAAWLAQLNQLSQRTDVPLVATGNVVMHVRSRKPLHDALVATRVRQPVAECGAALAPNAEAHLRSRARLARTYRPEWLQATLELAGRPYVAVDGGEAALKALDEQAFSIVVSDVRMMPMDGITLLKEIRARLPHLPVVLMTAYAEVDKAVDAMRSGACDFLLKPFEPQALLAHINKYELPDTDGGDGVIAIDPASRELFAMAQRVAQTDATVLLTGESGVGKEVVARFIHRSSGRKNGYFLLII